MTWSRLDANLHTARARLPRAQLRNTHHGNDDAANHQPPRRPVALIASDGREDEPRAKRDEEERGASGA